METRAVRRQRATAVILSTACIALALSITDNARGSPQAPPFFLRGATAVSPTSLAFGSQHVGTTSTAQTVTLRNTGNAALSITSLALTGTNGSNFAETNTCGKSLAAGAHCTISVTFTPSASGNRTASLSITDNARGSPQRVSLSGTGTAAVVSLSPTSLAFGSQAVGTTSTAHTVTLSNTGNAALSSTSLALTGTNASDFAQTNTCGSSVAAGAHCTISVTFKPSASGSRTASVSITGNACGSPQRVSLSGTGKLTATTGTAPVDGLSPTSLAFGNQSVGATSTAQIATLSNTGNAALSITSLALTGSNASDFAQTNTCGSSVAASANCTISVTFKPAASGSRTASVSITDNTSGSPQTVSLSGTGMAPEDGLSPTSLAFGNVSIGTTSTAQTATLSNSGNAAMSITSLALTGSNASDFAQTNTCGSSVAAGASCTISVTFTPAASGSRTASVSITDNAPGSPQSVSLTGAGSNPQPSLTSLSPASAPAGSAAQTLTLNGTNFLASSTVTYNGVGHAATFVSSTQLTISLSATDQATGGSYAVVVTNPAPGGGASSPLSFAVNNAAPTLTSLSPASAVVGAASQTLTLNGTNFLASSTVTYNGVGHTATFVSSTQLTISLSATDQATGGSYAVVVTNPGSGGGASSPLNFAVNNPAPTLTSLSPASAVAGSGAQTLTLNGTNLLASSTVTYNGVGHAATFVSSTQLTISLSATDQATTGSYAVVVTNPGPGGGASSPLNFTVGGPIVSLSPTSLAFGNQAVDMTSTAQTVTLSNTGSAALSITSLALSGTNASDFDESDTCGSSLAAGANCTIAVWFMPSVAGPEAASLSIADNSSGSPQTVGLSGAGTHDVILTWTASTTSGVVGYDVYRGTTSGGPYPTQLNSTPINGTTYTDETVQAGQTYYYVVTAVASDGIKSAYSNQVSATVP